MKGTQVTRNGNQVIEEANPLIPKSNEITSKTFQIKYEKKNYLHLPNLFSNSFSKNNIFIMQLTISYILV
jgi:hypothetical protein